MKKNTLEQHKKKFGENDNVCVVFCRCGKEFNKFDSEKWEIFRLQI